MKRYLCFLCVVVLLLAVYLLFQGLFIFLAMFCAVSIAGRGGDVPLDDMLSAGNPLDHPVLQSYAVDAMGWGLFLAAAAMLLFIHKTGLFRLRAALLRSVSLKPLLLSVALVFSAIFALNIFVQWFPLEDKLATQFDGLTHTFIGALTVSVLAPLLEEVMFRGAIQGYMMRRVRNPWLAIVMASLVFGIFHMNPVQTVYAAMLGLVLGWIYYRTCSLLPVIAGHVLNNTLATLVLVLFGSDADAGLQGSASPGTVDIPGILCFILFALLSVYFARKLNVSLPVPAVPWREVGEDG